MVDLLPLYLSLKLAAVSTAVLMVVAAPISYALCGVATLFLCKYTGGIGYLSIPLNFIALFFGMLTSNWLLHGVDMHIDKLIVQPVIIHVLGMTMAGLVVMYFFSRNAMRDG